MLVKATELGGKACKLLAVALLLLAHLVLEGLADLGVRLEAAELEARCGHPAVG